MAYFTPVDGEIILVQKGIHRVAKLAQGEDGLLYARRGSGYIRLKEHGATSVSYMHWRATETTPTHHFYIGQMRPGPLPEPVIPNKPRRLKTITRTRAA